jgi:hypothetical protein
MATELVVKTGDAEGADRQGECDRDAKECGLRLR